MSFREFVLRLNPTTLRPLLRYLGDFQSGEKVALVLECINGPTLAEVVRRSRSGGSWDGLRHDCIALFSSSTM